MSDVGKTVHGKACAWHLAMPAWSVERERRDVHYVAFVGDDNPYLLDCVADLALHDQPVFRTFGMIVAAILFIDGRKLARVPINNVRDGSIIMDEAAAFILGTLRQVVQIDMRL